MAEHYYYGNSLIAAEYAQNAETALYYYLTNSHGDVIGLTDNHGTLTETYRYDAFGTLTSIHSLNENGVLEEAETALSRFLYAGEQYDTVTGLYYLRARQYDTVIGRFIQEDTYLGDGRNLYVYVQNNPLKYVDPSGHCGKGLGVDAWERMNAPYIEMSETALELYDPVLEAQRKANQERIENGLYTFGKGLLVAGTGAILVYFMPATAPAWLQLVGTTLGTASMGMGVSDINEGSLDVYYGMTGNLETQTVNLVEEFYFGGDEATYQAAENAIVIAEGIFAIGTTVVPEIAGFATEKLAALAEFFNQGQEFIETLDDEAENSTLTDVQKSRLDTLYNTIADHLTESDFSGTLRDLMGDPVPNGKGGYFDHAGEMKDSYNSLQKIIKSLEGSL